MTEDKKLDRKEFLTSAVTAWAVVSLGACSDEGDGGGTDDGGGGATGGSATGGTATGGSATGGSSTGGSSTGGSSTGGGGGGYTCTAETSMVSSGTPHSHPLTIPGTDIERGYQDRPYPLEDGGTGHTHTLELAPYEWPVLAGGSQIDAPSSEDAGHYHTVIVNCVID